MSKFFSRLGAVVHFTDLFQAIVVFGFLLVFAPLCLLNGLYGGAAIMAILAIIADLNVVEPLLMWCEERTRKLVVYGLVVAHVLLAVAGIALMLRPLDNNWQQVEGTHGWSNTVVASSDSLVIAQSKGKMWRISKRAQANVLVPELPSFAWRVGATSTRVWQAPRTAPFIAFFSIKTPEQKLDWLKRPLGELSEAHVSDKRAWVIVDRLFQRTNGTAWEPVLSNVRARHLCMDGERVVLIGQKTWHESTDQGDTWRDITPKHLEIPSGYFFDCALKGDTLWVYDGGMLRSHLFVRNSDTWSKPTLPVRDARVIKIDPLNTQRAVLGSWGEGVWLTRDGGKTWKDLGLQGVEVRTLAFLPGIKQLSVASSNSIFNKGVIVYTPSLEKALP